MLNHNQITVSDQLVNYDYSRKEESKDSIISWMSKISKSTVVLKEHVTLAPKVTETVKGKLSLGARIVKAGGIEKVFKRYFAVSKNEKLVKASQCYLSTTTGPIAGLLFISSEKIAFRSDRSLTLSAANGDIIRVPYKVSIPLNKISGVCPSTNVKNEKQKYIQIVTVDDFEFWFMGFLSYQRSLKYLEHVVTKSEISS